MQPKLKGFTPKECSVWTYYIPKKREESEWDLYFVLLAAFLKAKGIQGRVAQARSLELCFLIVGRAKLFLVKVNAYFSIKESLEELFPDIVMNLNYINQGSYIKAIRRI